MNLSIDFVFLNLNAAVTFFLGFTIVYFLRIGRLERHIFYYSWSIGFILYSAQLFARANGLFPNILATASIMIPALVFFLWGLWSLCKGKMFFYIAISILLALGALSFFYVASLISLELALSVGQSFWYLPIVTGILHQRIVFGKNVDKFAFGWLMLFFANLFLLNSGWIGDFFGIASKLVILAGALDYEFVILSDRINRNINQRIPPVYTGDYQEGGMKLVVQNVTSKNGKNVMRSRTNWIFKKMEENAENDSFSYLFSFQDVTSHENLRRLKWINPERVFIFLFSDSGAFRENDEFTVLPMGITQIGATLSEIAKKIETRRKNRSEQSYTIIFDNLSILIHSFGANRVYNLLLSKMGILRANGVELFSIIHPETHSDISIVPLFKGISDDIINP